MTSPYESSLERIEEALANILLIQDDKFYRPKECLPVMSVGKTKFYYLIQIGAMPPLEHPYPGSRISGYWGRTFRSALRDLQGPAAPPSIDESNKVSAR